VSLAKQRNTSEKVRYFQGDVTKLINQEGSLIYGLEKGSFDAVTIILAIQNITPLSAVWKAVCELLKPNGRLVIVMMHPSFRIPQSGDWQWNEKESRQERVMWNYLGSHEVEIKTNPGKANSNTNTIHFHRPLQAYINTLGNSSLYVDHIEEWASNVAEQPGIKSEALLRAKKEFPLFLAIRARKV
jgi:SAM-dependent methyltransferase